MISDLGDARGDLNIFQQSRRGLLSGVCAFAVRINLAIGLGAVEPIDDVGLDERLMLGTERLTEGLR
jgi:hypothetical protein